MISEYMYIKDIEIEDGTVVPVGHHSIHTYSSTAASTNQKFMLVGESAIPTGLVTIECVNTYNQVCVVSIPLPTSETYTVSSCYYESIPNKISCTKSDNSVYYELEFKEGTIINVRAHLNGAAIIQEVTTDIQQNLTELTKLSTVDSFSRNVTYGTEDPSEDAPTGSIYIKYEDS